MQESVMVTRGVTNLGYCTDCNVNVLIVDEIQDRSGDEQKSIYISCSKCHKRGGNIRYYTEGEYDELASQASSSPSSSSSSM
jgi:cytochrome c553